LNSTPAAEGLEREAFWPRAMQHIVAVGVAPGFLQPLAAIRLLSDVEESIECSVSWVFFGPFPMPAKP